MSTRKWTTRESGFTGSGVLTEHVLAGENECTVSYLRHVEILL